jgi:Ca2+-binding RTX toxin-like protein
VSIVLRAFGVVGLLLICVAVVATAANTVPASNVGSSSTPITANTLKPAACNGITLTNLVIGNNGTAAADLVLGSAGVDNMNGAGGNDCILGGGGNDTIAGGAGTDVCIGGPGTDTFNGNCETQIQ